MHSALPVEVMCLKYGRVGQPRNIAVLILDHEQDLLSLHCTEEWSALNDSEVDILSCLARDLHATAGNGVGGRAVLAHLRATLPTPLLITEMHSDERSSHSHSTPEHMEQQLLSSPTHVTTSHRVSATLVRIFRHVTTTIRRTASSWLTLTNARLGQWVLSPTCALVACLVITVTVLVYMNGSKRITAISTTIVPATPQPLSSERPDPGSPSIPQSSPIGAEPMRPQMRTRRKPSVKPTLVRHLRLPVDTPTSPLPHLTAQADIQVTRHLPLPSVALESVPVPAPPEQEGNTVKKVLKAVVYPFRKVGQALAR